MLVIGEGGTGKSVLIDAITKTFEFHGKRQDLAECGTSGIATSSIKGQTVHSWTGLSVRWPKMLDWVQRMGVKTISKWKCNISGKKCLVIDEMSLLHNTLFSDVAEVVRSQQLSAMWNTKKEKETATCLSMECISFFLVTSINICQWAIQEELFIHKCQWQHKGLLKVMAFTNNLMSWLTSDGQG